MRAPKVCGEPGCPADAEPGGGRCPQHKKPPWQGGQQGKHSSTWAWQKLRRAILDRDGHRCTCDGCPRCTGRPCSRPATDVDHIVPRAKGGGDAPANLRSLCGGPGSCHAYKSSQPEGGAK